MSFFISAQQASFSSRPPDGVIKARIGQDVTFNWNYTVEDGESLVLMKLDYSKTYEFDNTKNTKRIAYQYPHSMPINKVSKKKVHVARTGALTLYNVTVEDQGFYKCTVSLDARAVPLTDTTLLLVGSKLL